MLIRETLTLPRPTVQSTTRSSKLVQQIKLRTAERKNETEFLCSIIAWYQRRLIFSFFARENSKSRPFVFLIMCRDILEVKWNSIHAWKNPDLFHLIGDKFAKNKILIGPLRLQQINLALKGILGYPFSSISIFLKHLITRNFAIFC